MLPTSQHRKPEETKRQPVTLSLPRWIIRKLNRKAKQQCSDATMVSRSDVAAQLLEEALR